MFPQTQKHTLGRVVDLDVTQKHSIFKGLLVTSIRPSRRGCLRPDNMSNPLLYQLLPIDLITDIITTHFK